MSGFAANFCGVWNDFEVILESLKNFRIVASDIVELSPKLDNSGVSSVVAAKVLRSWVAEATST